MLRLLLAGLAGLAVLCLAAFWLLTRPTILPESAVAAIVPDPARGEYVFRAAGCASCHTAPDSAADSLVLSGGRAFPSAFGTFYAPNISPDPVQGIGGWRPVDMVNALHNGVSPEGHHYYPVFPYASFRRMTLQDAVSLAAYLATLPPDATPSRPHEVRFPFGWRRLLGGWKLLFLRDGWVVPEVPVTAEPGRYLVEALAHCGECHTPRNLMGGLRLSAWLGGTPNPVGKGRIPNITPGGLTWAEADIVSFLRTGITPDIDTAGGDMVKVIANLATLPETDIVSIAAYLKSVPAVLPADK